MPRKKAFEDDDYDPIAAEAVRGATTVDGGGERPESRRAAPAATLPLPAREVTPRSKPAAAPPAPPREKQADIPEPLSPQRLKPASADKTALAEGLQKRFKVTLEENTEYEALIQRLRETSASGIDFSVLCRATWAVLRHSEPQLIEALGRRAMPKRPSKHDPLALAEYEERWSQVLADAFRKMPPVK